MRSLNSWGGQCWSLPGFKLDHDECRWDLLSLASGALHSLMCDAWYQRLARDLSRRQDFAGLEGLTWPPSRHEKRLSLYQCHS